MHDKAEARNLGDITEHHRAAVAHRVRRSQRQTRRRTMTQQLNASVPSSIWTGRLVRQMAQLGAGLRGVPSCFRAGACGAGRLAGLLCLRYCVAWLGRGHRLVGGAVSGAGAVGFLSARPTAVARVGPTVERRAALPAVQSASDHNEMLQLSLQVATPKLARPQTDIITFTCDSRRKQSIRVVGPANVSTIRQRVESSTGSSSISGSLSG